MMARTTKRQQRYELEQAMRRKFADIHHKGAQEFGGLWLTANDNAINRIRPFFDVADPVNKAIVSAVILSTLRSAKASLRREAQP